MTAKEWMSRGISIDGEISALLDAQNTVKSTVEGACCGHDNLDELEDEIEQRVKELCRVKLEIIRAMDRLDDGRLRELLVLRYVAGKNMEQIAEEMGFSYRHILRLHQEALEKITGVIELDGTPST